MPFTGGKSWCSGAVMHRSLLINYASCKYVLLFIYVYIYIYILYHTVVSCVMIFNCVLFLLD